MKLIHIKSFFLDLLFPIKCLGCKKEIKSYLCNECIESIPLEFSDTPTSHLEHLYSVANFDHPLLSRCIKEFKYRFVRDLAKPLSSIIIRSIEQNDLQFNSPIAIPVPLSHKRFNWRGFNQAELIAKHLAEHFDWEIDTNIISRTKTSKPQADIENKEEREVNIRDNFVLVSEINVSNRNFILIDDVTTTGSTINECAKILKQNGAKSVIGFTVARG
jgi:ComF family protein